MIKKIINNMEKINIAELLKDCPKGIELDCTMWDNCSFEGIEDVGYINILVKTPNGIIKLSKDGCFVHNCDSAKCVIFPKGKTTWEGFQRPFKNGDVLVHTQNDRFVMSIYKSNESETIINTYIIFWDRGEGLSVGMQICCYTDSTRLATKKEKEKLFQAIKDNGYRWNPETKTLEKLIEPKFKVGDRVKYRSGEIVYRIVQITEDSYVFDNLSSIPISIEHMYNLVPNKFDITTLKPFDKVFVRDNNTQEWVISFFSHCNGLEIYKYSCINGHGYAQCIPYEGNQHLLGTTTDCDDFYKTWEK